MTNNTDTLTAAQAEVAAARKGLRAAQTMKASAAAVNGATNRVIRAERALAEVTR